MNNSRISPPRQSRHSNRKAKPKRVENVLLPPLSAITASDTRHFLVSSTGLLIAYRLTGDQPHNAITLLRESFIMCDENQGSGEFAIEIEQEFYYLRTGRRI